MMAPSPRQVTNRMFLAVWFTGVPTSMGAIAVFALNHDFLAIRREIKNGSFSPWAYILSNAIFQARSPHPPPPPVCAAWQASPRARPAGAPRSIRTAARIRRAPTRPVSTVRLLRPRRGSPPAKPGLTGPGALGRGMCRWRRRTDGGRRRSDGRCR